MQVKKLTSKEQFNELKNSESAIFMFSAGWCPDCRVIEPILPQIEADYPAHEFVEVNRDDFIDICQEYDIYGIPSFLAFSGGQETGRFVSKDRKTDEEIRRFIDSLSS